MWSRLVFSALVLAKTVLTIAQESPDKYSQFNRAQSLNREVSYRQPTVIHPGRKSTNVDLTVREVVNYLDSVELRHRSYNEGLVGPTIRVNPGQELRITLRNRLKKSANSGSHDYQSTNLHTHGLHVSPKSPEDDVFLSIGPGETFEYKFKIPRTHHPGTFWYHAHQHGSTALQLASGMSGALIINGGLDNAPVVRNAVEKVMVLQQFTYREVEGEPAFVDPKQIYSGTGTPIEAINGVVTPTVTMRPGEVQRWRIIHAGTTESIRLNLEGINFYEIAVDGLATGKIIERNEIELYPGYRVDVLVKAPDAKQQTLMTSQILKTSDSIRAKVSARRDLLRLAISGEPKPMRLPLAKELVPYAAFKDSDIPTRFAKRRVIQFGTSPDGKKFLVNGKEFDPNVISQLIHLNTEEEWEIVSEGGVHPFHIHVNPFASRLKNRPNDPWVWRDTIAVKRGRPVLIRTRYTNFTGKTVLHCHNLMHEDLGMMQAIEIVSKSKPLDDVPRKSSPIWSAKTLDGNVCTDKDFKHKKTLLILHRGMSCVHCAEQLILLKKHLAKFQQVDITLVAISQSVPESPLDLKVISSIGFPVLVDKDLECFRKFDCLRKDGVPLHGLFLISPNGEILSEARTESAITNIEQLVDRFINHSS